MSINHRHQRRGGMAPKPYRQSYNVNRRSSVQKNKWVRSDPNKSDDSPQLPKPRTTSWQRPQQPNERYTWRRSQEKADKDKEENETGEKLPSTTKTEVAAPEEPTDKKQVSKKPAQTVVAPARRNLNERYKWSRINEYYEKESQDDGRTHGTSETSENNENKPTKRAEIATDNRDHGTNSAAEEVSKSEESVQKDSLKRRGHNKLISKTRLGPKEVESATHWRPRKRHWSETRRGQAYQGTTSYRSAPFYKPKKCGATPKRVKLNPSEEAPENGESQTLTKFAYRTTAKRGAKKSRAIVRVQPNEATTPICSTFLRGIECTDVKCTKRHDVPREAAMPLCLYFQRGGQCLKRETCKFRHVKVNPHATICPSFSLLGFCEQKDCQMKHVRPSNPTFCKEVARKQNI